MIKMRAVEKSFFILLIFVLAVPISFAAAQNNLRLSVDEVTSDAFPAVEASISILSSQGLPIKGLTANDISALEDGQAVTDLQVNPTYKKALEIALVLDVSRSMEFGNKPIDSLRDVAHEFVNGLATDDQVSVIAFSGNVTVTQELSADRSAIGRGIDSLSIGNARAAVNDGLMQALAILDGRAERPVILLVTDSTNYAGSTYTLQDVLDRAARIGAIIYPIGWEAVNRNDLKKLADLTNGELQILPSQPTLPDRSALRTAFTAVSNHFGDLREQYSLAFTSKLKADNSEHELVIKVNYLGATQEQTTHFKAVPHTMTITFPGLTDGQTVGGNFRFEPQIVAPSDVSELDIALDGAPLTKILAPPFVYAWDTTGVAPGPHEFTFLALDASGNQGTAKITLNVQPPITVQIATPREGQVLNAAETISVTVSAQSQIARVEFWVDGALLSTVTGKPFATQWNLAKVPAGSHVIKAVAYDVNNFVDESQVTVQTIPAPVVIQINKPENGVTLTNAFPIAVSVTSTVPIDRVELFVDGVLLGTVKAPPYVLDWDVAKSMAGAHILKATAFDINGNTAETQVSVTVALQQKSGMLWFALVAVAAVAGIVIPLAIRGRRRMKTRQSSPATMEMAAPPPQAFAHPGQAVLREIEGLSPNQVWPLTAAEVRLGRKRDENDIPLNGLKASRKHAVILLNQGQHIIYSLNPDNPVLVNGVPVLQQQTLRPGDNIQAGETLFRYEA